MRRTFLATAICLPLLASCRAFRLLEHDLEELERFRPVNVTLVNPDGGEGMHTLYVFSAETNEAARFRFRRGAGRIEMDLEEGDYYFAAYEDTNDSAHFDEGEMGTVYGLAEADRPVAMTIERGLEPLEIELTLGSTGDLSEETLAWVQQARDANPELRHNVARDAQLSEVRFDQVESEKGMWQPSLFIEEKLPGMYLLEPYDPNRTPVLFVHGIGGSPREFESIVDALDKERFQAWVFFYPSGLRLGALGGYLRKSIDDVCALHKADKIAVIAHSMGGLVSTNAVTRPSDTDVETCLFVTIASPLNGIASAGSGVEWAPTVMPSWYDLTPQSGFLNELYATMPEDMPYYLGFAFLHDGDPSGDGVVPMRSQLRSEAQEYAREMRGYNASHVGVLSDPGCIEWLNGLLDEHAAPSAD